MQIVIADGAVVIIKIILFLAKGKINIYQMKST